MSWPTLCSPMNCSKPGFPVLYYLTQFAETHVHWINDAIQSLSSSVTPFSCPQSFLASGSFPMSWLFPSGGQSIGTSASASVPSKNIQGWFPLTLTGLISCCPRYSQEPSPAPQFESIKFSALSRLYGPTFTSIYDYWKKHSFDYLDLCRQSDVSVFKYTV